VLAFADVMNLFTDELASLCRRSSPGTLQLAGTIDGGFLGHRSPPGLSVGATQMPETSAAERYLLRDLIRVRSPQPAVRGPHPPNPEPRTAGYGPRLRIADIK
jgi:hypothetical protein